MTAILLAIEASQRTGGVAVRDDRGESHAEPISPAARFDDDLLSAIDRLFVRVGLEPRRTEVIGVSIGPGGFTGLRISVSTAKMLAEVLGAEVVAVPSALVAAESHEGAGPILVALASKDQTAWVTRLERSVDPEAWTIVGEGGLADAEGLELQGIAAMVADRHLPQPMRDRCRAAGVEVQNPIFSPIGCLRASVRLFKKSQTTDPLVLAPIYPRPPSAVSIWERRHRL
jgi:tRNA threonylcarbamoyl adenosine modification protein YeaZ